MAKGEKALPEIYESGNSMFKKDDGTPGYPQFHFTSHL